MLCQNLSSLIDISRSEMHRLTGNNTTSSELLTN